MTETEIIQHLNFHESNFTEKAKWLGYKRKTVRIDGIKRKGWVNGDQLFTSVRELVAHHKRFPFGFDYYYWGYQLEKDKECKST